ncbi:hypothetical protein ACJ4V0_15490 [Phreatobacter sp. HK31-P]
MTGTVSWEILLWMIGVQFSTIAVALGAVFWIQAQFRAERESLQRHREEFHLFKERVAREYATSATLRQMEDKMAQGFNRLGDRFDAVMQKMMERATHPHD